MTANQDEVWGMSWSMSGCWLIKCGATLGAFQDFELPPEREAHGKLVVAAPELLAALEALLQHAEYQAGVIEGEFGSSRSLNEMERAGDLDVEIINAREAIALAKGGI